MQQNSALAGGSSLETFSVGEERSQLSASSRLVAQADFSGWDSAGAPTQFGTSLGLCNLGTLGRGLLLESGRGSERMV